MLPYRERLIHLRWSGEAGWIPLGDLDLGLGCENATSYPAPGQLLLHPGATEGLCFVACDTAEWLAHRGTVGNPSNSPPTRLTELDLPLDWTKQRRLLAS